MRQRLTAAVVAAHPLAAQTGAGILGRGGTAVDAAIATAFALAVVDPQNCGIGGHGGAMLVQPAARAPATLVDFNTAVPADFNGRLRGDAKRCGAFLVSGAGVSPPAVVAGLACAHQKFGKLAFGSLVEPAVTLAAGGHPVGPDLAHAIAWAERNHAGLSEDFQKVFRANGSPAAAGSLLKQQDLAEALTAIAQGGAAAFYQGPLAEAICRCVTQNGGQLAAGDLRDLRVHVEDATHVRFADASIYGPHERTSGFGILSNALAALDTIALSDNRSAQYARALIAALRHAWKIRVQRALPLAGGHTTHLCASDGGGMLVSMTFTHGPTWFGSGLIAPGTGIVLNSGANLFVRPRQGGAPYAMHNMSPVIVEEQSGARHAIGSPGGSKIPAIVMQLIVDAVHYGLPLAEAIKLPRVSVAPRGRVEAEPAMLGLLPADFDARAIDRSEYYGPASALSLSPDGHAEAALDPRFSPGHAAA